MNEMKKTARILVVDDEERNRRLLVAMLEAEGYSAAEAADGTQALELARQSPPDLVLLDIMMPGIDGYEVVRAHKSDAATKGIPIAMVTARGAGAEALFAAGINPAKRRKAGEVGVRRIEHVAALHRQRGKMGIRSQVPRGPEPLEFRPQPREVRIRWLRHVHMRQLEPAVDPLHDIANRKRPRHDLAVGGNANEPQHGRPREPDALGTAQATVPPAPRGLVNSGIGVMGVYEYVDVGQDHAGSARRRQRPPIRVRRRAGSACRDRRPAGTRRLLRPLKERNE